MKRNLKITIGTIFSLILLASCSKGSKDIEMESNTQIYELSAPSFAEGDGDQEDEIVRVHTVLNDETRIAVASTSIN